MDPITQQGLAGSAGAGGDPIYVDDVFRTQMYTGNQSTQTINNGIDLSGEGGLVWLKNRDTTGADHQLYDTERGSAKYVSSDNVVNQQSTGSSHGLQSFNSNGFHLGLNWLGENANTQNIVSWTFRKAPGFFDVVTYTGNGTSGRTISHSLGSTPGMVVIKSTSHTEPWAVWHRSAATQAFRLNEQNAASNENWFANSQPNSSTFTVGSATETNSSGYTYVAYIFAHDDQQFGENGDEAAIYCGNFNAGGTYQNNIIKVNCGFEPQWVMWKRKDTTGPWYIMDTTRKMANDGQNSAVLIANTDSYEYTPARFWQYENGFAFDEDLGGTSAEYIFVAIARPNKPPETGTEVFDVATRSGSSSDTKTNSSIFTDMSFVTRRDSSSEYRGIGSRIMGLYNLKFNNTDGFASGWLDSPKPWASMTGFIANGGNGANNTGNLVDYSFKRAPGFFDEVQYNGTGSIRSIDHNLRAVPQMMWIRSLGNYYNWIVYHSALGASKHIYINSSNGETNSTMFNYTAPTATQFTVGPGGNVNGNGNKHVVFLFGSVPGVSKVGSYTGTGGNINVDCGFTTGARFVLIKRTDASGNWYVFDTARGIVSGNDPYQTINTTYNEDTSADYIDPLNTGFTMTSSSTPHINTNGGSYIYLAIA